MIHALKTDPEPFAAVARGTKTFELRRADRPFGLLDVLHLRETQFSAAEMLAAPGQTGLAYTGHEIAARIVGILPGPCNGLEPGFSILSIVVLVNEPQPIDPAVLAGHDWNTTVNRKAVELAAVKECPADASQA